MYTEVSPRFSVIVPAYNAAPIIEHAIESALNQTYPPLEIIVIDDGSTDDTAEVVRRYGDRVRLIQQPNGGPGAARNAGARVATGDWLALLDADDVWLPHKLEAQRPHTADPAVGVIFCSRRPLPAERLSPGDAFDCLWMKSCVISSSALIRRAAFDAIEGFDEAREIISVEDYNLWLRLAKANWTFMLCPEQLSLYLPVEGHLSSQLLRVLHAELHNLQHLAVHIKLSESQVFRKRLAILEQFSRTAFYRREMSLARESFGLMLKDQVSCFALLRWVATFLPHSFWNWQRAHRQNLHDSHRRIDLSGNGALRSRAPVTEPHAIVLATCEEPLSS